MWPPSCGVQNSIFTASTTIGHIDTHTAAADTKDELNGDEKKVTWVELFFDLVFVYAVTRTAELLEAGHGLIGLAHCLVAFIPAYWMWVGTTMYANLHDPDLPRGRLGIFGVGACGLLMAIAIPDAFESTGLLFGLTYWAARLILLLLVTGQPHRKAYATFTVGARVTGPLLVIGGLMHGDARLGAWALAAAVDLGVPLVARRRLAAVPFRADHLVERYGTFILIALGETVVATAAGADKHIDAEHLLAVIASFVLICGLWWVYFTFGPDAIREALTASKAPIDLIRPVLSYGHLSLIAGIVAVAATLSHVVGEPAEALTDHAAALLFGGVAWYLVTFAFTRWQLFHTLAVPRLTTAAVVVVMWLFHDHFSALEVLTALAVAIAVLNAVELRILPKTLREKDEKTG